jgi:hypothetical protein
MSERRLWSRVVLIAKVLVIGGVFGYLLWRIGAQWSAVRGRIAGAAASAVAWAVVAQALSMVSLGLLWWRLLRSLGQRLSARAAARMHWLATLGKYVPGRVSTALGKVYLATVEGVRPGAVAVACGYEVLFCFVGSALVALAAVVFGSLSSIQFVTVPACVVVGGLLIGLHPRLALPMVNGLLRRLGREPIKRALSYPRALLFCFGYAAPYVLSGVAEFLLLRAFYEVPLARLVDMVGLTTVATALGYAVVFAPAGLGARDLLIQQGVRWLVPGRPGAGALLALSTRLFGLVMDFASGAAALGLYGRRLWARRGSAS